MKKNFGLLILVAGLLLLGINSYAADGDLIVNGHLQVTGEVRVYRIPEYCLAHTIENQSDLTTSSTCSTIECYAGWYYNCSGSCSAYEPMQCNNVLFGKLFP